MNRVFLEDEASINDIISLGKAGFLKELYGDDKSIDPDDTKVAREFYVRYWGKYFSISEESGFSRTQKNGKYEGKYGGETIFSFSTVAGWMIRALSDFNGYNLVENVCCRLEKIKDSPEIGRSMKEKFVYFYEIHHSLANFMPLPLCKRAFNLNLFKNSGYYDLPGLFFSDIQQFYINGVSGKTLDKFSCSNNLEYFKLFGNRNKTIDDWHDDEREQGWNNYVKYNYLGNFLTSDKSLYLLAPPKELIIPYGRAWRQILLKKEREEWIEYIDKVFLTNAIRIIEERAELLDEESSGL